MEPLLRPSIKSFALFEGVMETVVPGQTRTSPPRVNRSSVVSLPAVKADPTAERLPATTTSPIPLVTGTATGVTEGDSDVVCGNWEGGVFLATAGFGIGLRRTIKRSPATSHVYA